MTMARLNIVSWYFLSIINFGNLIDSTSNDFLCKNYYNNAIVTLKSNRNDSIRLSVLPTSTYHSFETAQKICQLCLDGGSLIQHSDIKQLLPYLPLWIGLKSRPNATTFNQTDWTWLDGSEFNQSEENFAVSIVHPKSFVKNVHYRFYAYPDNWNEDGITLVGDIFRHMVSDDKLSNRTGMKWVALWEDVNYREVYERLSSIFNSHVTDEEELKLRSPNKFIVCERPYRPSCHFWNYTQECSIDKNFGCHTYVNVMFHNSDKESVKCEAPKHRRVAKRCREIACTCKVTEWGAWSECGNEVCSSGQTTRIPWRNESDPDCPRSNVHPSLSEREPCEIPGCNSLLAGGDE